MAKLWKPNEEVDEDEELVVTDHRDKEAGIQPPDTQPPEETLETRGGEVLDEYGEDVASSPEQRAMDVPADTESLEDEPHRHEE